MRLLEQNDTYGMHAVHVHHIFARFQMAFCSWCCHA